MVFDVVKGKNTFFLRFSSFLSFNKPQRTHCPWHRIKNVFKKKSLPIFGLQSTFSEALLQQESNIYSKWEILESGSYCKINWHNLLHPTTICSILFFLVWSLCVTSWINLLFNPCPKRWRVCLSLGNTFSVPLQVYTVEYSILCTER